MNRFVCDMHTISGPSILELRTLGYSISFGNRVRCVTWVDIHSGKPLIILKCIVKVFEKHFIDCARKFR